MLQHWQPQPDLGTPPAPEGAARVRVTIDGRILDVAAGTSVMRAALDAGKRPVGRL